MRDKDTIAVSLRLTQIRELNKHPLTQTIGRSALIRLAIQSFLRQSRKVGKRQEITQLKAA